MECGGVPAREDPPCSLHWSHPLVSGRPAASLVLLTPRPPGLPSWPLCWRPARPHLWPKVEWRPDKGCVPAWRSLAPSETRSHAASIACSPTRKPFAESRARGLPCRLVACLLALVTGIWLVLAHSGHDRATWCCLAINVSALRRATMFGSTKDDISCEGVSQNICSARSRAFALSPGLESCCSLPSLNV